MHTLILMTALQFATADSAQAGDHAPVSPQSPARQEDRATRNPDMVLRWNELTLDAIRKLSVTLSVSADMLLFEKGERGPGEDLKLQFEAASRLDPEEQDIIRSVVESIIMRSTMKEAERRWSAASGNAPRG